VSSAYFDRAYGGDYVRRNPPYKWRAFLREVLRFRRQGTLREAGAHFDCVGCDVSEYAVRQARAHLPAAVPLFCGSLPALELRRGFDVLAAFDVIEHIEDLPRVFANAARLLRPGGLLVFTVPVYDGPLGWLVDRLDHDETHVHRRGRDFWLAQVPAPFAVRHYTGVWRYFLFGRFYLNLMSRLSRRWTTAILVVAEKRTA
jgi:SAM-dependent methyltransferase